MRVNKRRDQARILGWGVVCFDETGTPLFSNWSIARGKIAWLVKGKDSELGGYTAPALQRLLRKRAKK